MKKKFIIIFEFVIELSSLSIFFSLTKIPCKML